MTDITIDPRALDTERRLEELREAGAIFMELPTTGPLTQYEMAVRAMAYRGWCLPFRLPLGDTGARYALGYFGANDAGHAHVCSVHPDYRESLSWEMGEDVAEELHGSRWWHLVRELCRVP